MIAVARALAAVSLLAISTLAASSVSVFAAGSAPPGFTPDPKLQTESVPQLRQRITRACLTTQARAQGVTQAAVPARGCECYARTTLRNFTPAELQAYRDTGLFNESGRAKALAAIDTCGLKRPA